MSGLVCTVIQASSGSDFRIACISAASWARQRPSERPSPGSAHSRGPLAQLAEIAHAVGTDWALGTHARAAAMLAEGEAAERLYQEAVERLSHVKTCATLARAHLLYGEWLRRKHRRVDAREQLRVAYTMLSDMGMEAFTERARRELLATGATG